MIKKAAAFIGFILALTSQSFAQSLPEYGIKAKLNPVFGEIEVEQKIIFRHAENAPLNEFYLVDWNHAFSSTESPLAKRLVEEYTRSFYLSQKSKRGETVIQSLKINGKETAWERPTSQIDQIRILLESPLNKNTPLRIAINYRLKLPDSKFTGYGKLNEQAYVLENTFLRIARRNNNKWDLISHLAWRPAGTAGNFM